MQIRLGGILMFNKGGCGIGGLGDDWIIWIILIIVIFCCCGNKGIDSCCDNNNHC